MNIYSFSSLIASIFCLTSGIFVLVKRYRDKKCRYFAIASILTGLWSLFPFAISIAPDKTSALFFARLIYIPAIFTAPAWLQFVFSVIKEKWLKKERWMLISSYVLSVPLLLFSFSPLFLKGVNRFAPHFSVAPGPLYTYFVSIFALIFFYVIRTIFHTFKAASGYYRNQLKFILLSFIFGFLSGALHFGAAYFNREPFPHDLFLIGYTGLIAYAIFRYRLMDITVTITRTGVFVAVYTLVLGIPFLLAVWGKPWLIGPLGANWWVGPLILMAALATAGPYVYIFLEKRTEAILLREQRRYQETLKQAARELARIRNLKRLLKLITHIVTKTVRISHSSIYLYDDKSDQFLLKAGRNLKRNQTVFLNKENPLIRWLENQKEPLVYEEIIREAQNGSKPVFKGLTQQMDFLNAAVIVPGLLKDKLLGFLVLGNKRSGGFYSTEDLNTFSVLASEVALAIENALLYGNIEEQVRQRTKELIDVQKQLIQAEKMATVGTLAGGVAHEINNPLTAILTNVQMLLALNNSLDVDSKESLELIEEATKRCRTIVQKLMTYAKKPLETAEIYELNLLNVIKNVVLFLEYQLGQDNIKIIVDAKENAYSVMGNQNELEQVITNIVLNARDAIRQIKKGGNINISLSKSGEWIRIEIKDEGIGIPQEAIPKIFDPFFTTKEVGKGTGLGLSICQSIVEKHNGLIAVKSEPNKGSIFTIQFPKAKERKIANSKV